MDPNRRFLRCAFSPPRKTQRYSLQIARRGLARVKHALDRLRRQAEALSEGIAETYHEFPEGRTEGHG